MNDNRERMFYMLNGELASCGFDMWRHMFAGRNVRTGGEKVFFVDYYIINPGRGDYSPVFGEKGIRKPSYLMISAGCFGEDSKQVNRFFGTRFVETHEDELRIIAEDCILSDDAIRGHAEVSLAEVQDHPEYLSDEGRISWQLRVKRLKPYNTGYGASKYARKMNAFGFYRHIAGRKTLYSGTVFIDGDEYDVTPKECFGFSDKYWGSEFPTPVFRLAGCNMESKLTGLPLSNSSFAVWGGLEKAFGISLGEKVTGALNYEGTEIEFNFSGHRLLTEGKFKCFEKDNALIWKVHFTNLKGFTMDIAVKCKLSELLSMNLEAPCGTKNYDRLQSGGTGYGTIKLYKRVNGRSRLVDYIKLGNVYCGYGENNRLLPVIV